MLPPFYELGRNAAFGAIDVAHDLNIAMDLRSDATISAAYEVATSVSAETCPDIPDLPESFFDLAAGQLRDFLRGYFDALTEAGR